jgi:hypothetical protein
MKIKKEELEMEIRVINDGNVVFKGPAGTWLEDNDYDLDVARMIKDCFDTGRAEETWFASGFWIVERIGGTNHV